MLNNIKTLFEDEAKKDSSKSTEIKTDLDKSWMFTESQIKRPSFNFSTDYEKQCDLFAALNANLEHALMNYSLITRMLKDDYKATHKRVSHAYRKKKLLQEQAITAKIKKKRAKDAEKHFVCEVPDCQKEYCSIDALALHVKRKHPELVNKFCKKRKSIQDAVDDKVKSLNCFAKSVRRCRIKYDIKLEANSEKAMNITGHKDSESMLNHEARESSSVDDLDSAGDCISLCKGNQDQNALHSPYVKLQSCSSDDGTFGDLEGLPFI